MWPCFSWADDRDNPERAGAADAARHTADDLGANALYIYIYI